MIVTITDDIRIRSEDVHNWTVERRHVAKTGKTAGTERWKPLGYHGSIDMAAGSLLRSHLDLISDATELDLRELGRVFEWVGAHLREATTGAMAAELASYRERFGELDDGAAVD